MRDGAARQEPGPVRHRELDALRALSMLFIVGFFHVQAFWLWRMPASLAMMLARVVLGIFCFISGYLLASRYRLDDLPAVGRFFVRRVLRIYPLYLLTLAAFVALKLIPAADFLPGAFLLHFFLQRPLKTLWFVSLIFFLYALTPLFLWRPSPRKTLLLTAALYALALWLWPYDSRYLAAYGFGIFLAHQPAAGAFFLRPRPATAAASALLALALGIYVVRERVGDAVLWEHLFGVACFVAVVPFALALSSLTLRAAPWRIVSLVSNASFALYLVHRVFYKVVLLPYCPPSHTWASQLYLVFVLLPLAVLVAHGVQLLYDRAMQKAFPVGRG
jgi:peptidoglycan/LPS O-acetylase OafA/YrhL